MSATTPTPTGPALDAMAEAGTRMVLASAQRAIDGVRRGLREGCVYHDRLLSSGEMDALSDLISARLAEPRTGAGADPAPGGRRLREAARHYREAIKAFFDWIPSSVMAEPFRAEEGAYREGLDEAGCALDAALAQAGQDAEGSRPIETAPKDGTEVLLWDADIAGWDIGRWSEKHQCWVNDCHDTRLVQQKIQIPSHWRPLPAPPGAGTR